MISDSLDLPPETLRDIAQDAHLNFLLGAGASAQMFWLLGDVENVLTDIAGTASPAARVARAAVLASFFKGVIRGNIELIEHGPTAKNLLDSYRQFLKTINGILLRRRSSIISKQATIFTTNIDLAIEVASEDLQLELNDGFSGRFRPRFSTSNFGSVLSRRSLQYDNLSEIPTFNLLKLHGSVGWQTETRPDPPIDPRVEIVFDASLEVVRRTDAALNRTTNLPRFDASTSTTDLLAASAGKHNGIDEFLAAYDQLAIVNPTKEKFRQTVLNQNYYDLLRIFSNDLEKENTVLFVIGFSCRDEHIRELMVRAARTNPTLQVIIFAYDHDAKASILQTFDGYHISNNNIRVVSPQSEPPDDGVRFDLSTIAQTYFAPLTERQG